MNRYPSKYARDMQLTMIREGLDGMPGQEGLAPEEQEVYTYMGVVND